jgi:hypothetical protein
MLEWKSGRKRGMGSGTTNSICTTDIGIMVDMDKASNAQLERM